jgi:hypothetical protein
MAKKKNPSLKVKLLVPTKTPRAKKQKAGE